MNRRHLVYFKGYFNYNAIYYNIIINVTSLDISTMGIEPGNTTEEMIQFILLV